MNVRGINNIHKFNSLVTMISQFKCRFNFIVMSEVKLKTTFPFQLYKIPGFSRYECLRSEEGGGGIIVFVNAAVRVTEVSTLSSQFEKVRLITSIGNIVYRLLAYYRAPITSNADNFIDDLENEISSSDVRTFIVGDLNFNAPNLTINLPNDDAKSQTYRELLPSYGYTIANNLPTRSRSGKTIDHFVNNVHDKLSIHSDTIEIDPALTDHNIVISKVSNLQKHSRVPGVVKRSVVHLNRLLDNFPNIHDKILATQDPNEAADMITEAIQIAITRSSSVKDYKLKHEERINEWNSAKALRLMREKDKLLNKRRKKPTSNKIAVELEQVSAELRGPTRLTSTVTCTKSYL